MKKCLKISKEKCDTPPCRVELSAKCITTELDCCLDIGETDLQTALESICSRFSNGFTGKIENLTSITVECGLLTSATSCVDGLENGSFEDYVFLPTFRSQMDRLVGWEQATLGTSDFHHVDAYHFSGTSELLPPPDGKGFVGIFGTNNSTNNDVYKEYIGICLCEPLIGGQEYTITFYVAALSISELDGSSCNGGELFYSSPIDITVFGTSSDCVFPLQTYDCPTTADSNWEVIGSATYTPIKEWGLLEITFTPTSDINGVIIGYPCDLPSDYDVVDFCYAYFVIDDLKITKNG